MPRTTEELLKDAEGRVRRLERLLEKSNEFRRSGGKRVSELAEQLKVRTEKELTLDSEIAMNAILTKENQELSAKLRESEELILILHDRTDELQDWWTDEQCKLSILEIQYEHLSGRELGIHEWKDLHEEWKAQIESTEDTK